MFYVPTVYANHVVDQVYIQYYGTDNLKGDFVSNDLQGNSYV